MPAPGPYTVSGCRAASRMAIRLHEAGFIVYGAARPTDRMHELRERGIRTLTMDVTDEESAELGIKPILAEAGRIAVLVNCAGYGSYGPSRTCRSAGHGQAVLSPEVIAKAVVKAATARRPKTRYAVGSGAKLLIFLRRWLPDRTYDALIRRVSGLR
jgi:hypothetical protein